MTRDVDTAPRLDPYRYFRFRLNWQGRHVAGFSKVSMLKRTTELVSHRDGGENPIVHKSPGRTMYEAITLERGVTHDIEFEEWANQAWNLDSHSGSEVPQEDFRKDLVIELYDEAGQLAKAWTVHRSWVSEFQALPDLDANANAVAIQTIKLEHEGWELTDEGTESAEPNP